MITAVRVEAGTSLRGDILRTRAYGRKPGCAVDNGAVRRIAFVLLATIVVLSVMAIVRRADREPHKDEVEYLHAAWLMDKGERLYVTFFEHHPPFLFATLRLVAGDDIRPFFVRARLLSGAFALAALLAYAAIVWRMRPEAASIALALLLIAPPMWLAGLTAARSEPFALAFFWGGCALILLARGNDRAVALLTGLGIGLVAIAALWNPKWPLCSLVVAAFWFHRARRRVMSAAVAAIVAGTGVLAMAMIAPLDRIRFFVIEFNRALWPWISRTFVPKTGEVYTFGTFAPGLLRPIVALIAFAIVLAALRRLHDKYLPLFFVLLAVAASIELRFLFPYPMLWSHYYVMWGFACAALVAIVPASIEALTGRAKIGAIIAVAIALVIVPNLVMLAPFGEDVDDGPYWTTQRYLQQRLRPGDTVLIELSRHPVAARDATYYWFGFEPPHASLLQTPRGARYLRPPDELPFCALARGGGTSIRYISHPRVFTAPAAQLSCFQQLLAAGRVRRTPAPEVFEIVR